MSWVTHRWFLLPAARNPDGHTRHRFIKLLSQQTHHPKKHGKKGILKGNTNLCENKALYIMFAPIYCEICEEKQIADNSPRTLTNASVDPCGLLVSIL
ncbi:psychosine receptor isoform X2 [Macaca nemestrina]|uniref:psychosine receptor isoform X2 n=1 Tax=Macaca nemestrina TaxID=9545 RepID=UPI0039B96E2F